ncbi:hypothetical protein [Janthinobacterium sp. 17J80-10]|uniref:hypothetical protein n=1 Tax=Janthinobacterium sp. 17J80-10 TaxID=2497863 RepID=UPI0010058E57|nr:hypothetical protein [Janthinobacterium sp. 17J80-10]QAU35141.1 hypothetical protein EKL02_13670 [Janthinobacterium sp. 17J80-10]
MLKENESIQKKIGRGRCPESDSVRMENRIRTIATVKWAMRKKAAVNPHQFSQWFDDEIHRLDPDGRDSQSSGKWRKNLAGDVALGKKDLRVLAMLIPDAENYFQHGPENLWDALWGDESRLWEICTIKGYVVGINNEGEPAKNFITLVGPDIPFNESLSNFERSLLAKYKRCNGGLEMKDLVSALSLYRLHQRLVQIARIDGTSAYRCVKLCLWSPRVSRELEDLQIYDRIATDLLVEESDRIKGVVAHRKCIAKSIFGSEDHPVEGLLYALDPFEFYSMEKWIADLGMSIDYYTHVVQPAN